MERPGGNEVILLFDYFNRGSLDLFDSFKNTDIPFKAVVINDEGFLPDGIINVFEYFLGDFKSSDKCQGRPLYFNQIVVPDYWEISANNTSGSIHDKERERGRIFFSKPTHRRFVKVVDYLDEYGFVRCSEHYNKYGAVYARTTFNKDGKKFNKSYFDVEGREVIVENFVTSDIILNYQDKILRFKNRVEFVCYFIRLMDWEAKPLYFNSLSIPFFVSNILRPAADGKNDILFWQEPTGDSIPGNMTVIFQDKATRCSKVVVQNHPSYIRLGELDAPKDKLKELGFIYSFKKQNRGRPEALICTNTENVEKLREIVEAVPEIKFHVTALTEMSGKLLSHEKYENVIMYPNIKAATLERLFMQCDFYLDINHEGEIVEATRNAFIHNQLILGFKETLHGPEYISPENIFISRDYMNLVKKLKDVLGDKKLLESSIISQQKAGITASKEDYRFNY